MTSTERITTTSPQDHVNLGNKALADAMDELLKQHPDTTTALAALATAHYAAAQAKMKMDENPYGDLRPWHGRSS